MVIRTIRRLFTLHRHERGQALVLLALFLTGLLSVAGLAIDIGYARWAREKAQVAADAAATAGADVLPNGNAVSTATSMATTNGFTSGGSVTVTVNNPPTSGSHSSDTGSVEVIITKQVSTFFLPVMGLGTITAKARSVATSKFNGAPCALCVMASSGAQTLKGGGTSSYTVGGPGILVNSSSTDAADLGGSATIVGTAINVVGTAGGSVSHFSPTPTNGYTAITDPLSGVPVPSVSGSNKGSVSSGTISPGIYTNLSVGNHATLTLNPGTYVITGTVTLQSGGILNGSGVTFYFACSSYPTPCSAGQSGGSLNLNGGGDYTISAPTSGTYQGLSVFYDRKNAASLTLQGNSTDTFTGTVYALSSAAALGGTSSVQLLDSMVVTNTVTLGGNSNMNLGYTTGNNYAVKIGTGSSNLTE